MVKVKAVCRSYCGSSIEKLKYCRSIGITSIISCHAKPLPMQPLAPLPNGFHEFDGSLSKFSSSIRSGLNSSASLPNTAGSLWTLWSTMSAGSPASRKYLPPSTSPLGLFGVTANPGAVEYNLAVSRNTAVMYLKRSKDVSNVPSKQRYDCNATLSTEYHKEWSARHRRRLQRVDLRKLIQMLVLDTTHANDLVDFLLCFPVSFRVLEKTKKAV